LQLPNQVAPDEMDKVFLDEEEILSNLQPEGAKFGQLTVNTDLLKLRLKSALSTARNAQLFPKQRESIGGFIYRSFAKSGLMVASESFQYKKVTVDSNMVRIQLSIGREASRVIIGSLITLHCYNVKACRAGLILKDR
jgi:hypothetical protein